MSHPLQIVGLCLMKVQRSKVCQRALEKQLRHHYDGLVYKTTVPYSAVVEEACSRNLTVGEYAPAKPGRRCVRQSGKGADRWPEVWGCKTGYWQEPPHRSKANGELADSQVGDELGHGRGGSPGRSAAAGRNPGER